MADETLRVEDKIASAADICDWLGISAKAFHNLADMGVVVRISNGKFLLKATIRNAYERAIKSAAGRDGGPTGKARARLLETQARLASIKEEVLKGDLVRQAVVLGEWSDSFRQIKARLLALPARLSAQLPHLTLADISIIDMEIRAFLVELADPTTYSIDVPSAGDVPAAAASDAEPMDRIEYQAS